MARQPAGNRGDANQDIEDRFCRHSNDGGRTVVFYHAYRCTKDRREAGTFVFELDLPIRVLFHEEVGVMFQPEHWRRLRLPFRRIILVEYKRHHKGGVW
jgi:hypothetical protein